MNVTPGTAPIIRTKTLVAIDVDDKPGKIQSLTEDELKAQVAEIPEKKVEPKKPFVLKPHLTTRPFNDSPELEALKKELQAQRYRASNNRLRTTNRLRTQKRG